jgi:hypothetical protein
MVSLIIVDLQCTEQLPKVRKLIEDTGLDNQMLLPILADYALSVGNNEKGLSEKYRVLNLMSFFTKKTNQ